MDSFDWKKSLSGLGIVLVLGAIGLFAKSQARTEPSSDTKSKSKYATQKSREEASPDEAFNYSEPYKTIKVDISGHVLKPGVYEITEGSRLQDLVKLAGGLTPKADRDAVNLAVKLQDEQKVVILGTTETIGLDEVKTLNGSIRPLAVEDETPVRSAKRTKSPKKSTSTKDDAEKPNPGEMTVDRMQEWVNYMDEATRKREKGSSATSNLEIQQRVFSDPYGHRQQIVQPKSSLPTERVSLNRATDIELGTLPGIGPTIAKRIIGYRKTRAFGSISDLRRVKGIGPNVYRKLSPWLKL